jgi:hypothetical protein
VTRYKAEDYVSESLTVGGVVYGDPASVRGQMLPMGASAAYDRTGLNLSRPHEWLWDSGDSFTPGDLVSFDGRWFRVASPSEVFAAELITRHVRCVMDEIEAEPVIDSNPEL